MPYKHQYSITNSHYRDINFYFLRLSYHISGYKSNKIHAPVDPELKFWERDLIFKEVEF